MMQRMARPKHITDPRPQTAKEPTGFGRRDGPRQHTKDYLPANTKWNDTSLLARCCMYALQGNSKADCFRLIGIHVDSGHAWLARGRDEENAPLNLKRFYRIFERAFAHYNKRNVKMVERAAQSGAPNTWQAAAWMLERRDPENWSRNEKRLVRHEGTLATGQPLNQIVLVNPEAAEISRKLLQMIAGPSEGAEVDVVEGEVVSESDDRT